MQTAKKGLSHTTIFIKRMAVAYLLYFVLRTLFLLFNFKLLSTASFGDVLYSYYIGLLFDSSAIVYSYSLFILLSIVPFNFRSNRIYQKIILVLFMVSSSVAIVLNAIDFEFSKFQGKRSGVELFSTVTDEGNDLSTYFVDFWYLGVIMLILGWITYKVYPKAREFKRTPYIIGIPIFILIAGISFLGARGGIALKPIKSFAAAKYVPSSMVQLTLNTPFNIISTIDGEVIEFKNYLPEEKAIQVSNPVKFYGNDSFDQLNIVLLIMESFGKEYIGYLGGEKPSTPFLDSLSGSQSSFAIDTFYTSGTKSIHAVPSILSGIPDWMNVPYTNSIYHTNEIENIGTLLSKYGYHSAFFHGSKNGTMGFQNFLSIGGMNNYYGLTEYPYPERDFDGHWGIYDEPYLDYVRRQLGEIKSPFFASIFTLSSHHPYSLPDDKAHLFTEYPDKTSKSVAYADYSLRNFFNASKSEKWFDNTLFVITADHSSKSERQYYLSYPGRFEAPLIIHRPLKDTSELAMYPTKASHIDLMPSILDYINYPDSFYCIGNSIFDPNMSSNYPITFLNGEYRILDGNKFVTMDVDGNFTGYHQVLNDGSSRKLNKDGKSEELFQQMRANVQVFINSVLRNETRYD
jgi:phosphoglycerol transferase MdoB-like AlkP superfamily enzyme